MKRLPLFCSLLLLLFSSCRLLHIGSGRQEQSGCPSNGRNVGAEKLASGDPKATAEAKKAGKFTKGMSVQYK